MTMTLGRAATIWVHLALALMIAGAVTFVVVGLVYVAPICNEIVADSAAGPRGFDAFITGATAFLGLLHWLVDYAAWWAVALLVVWAILERRVLGENKPAWRLSVMAAAAMLFWATVIVFAGTIVIPTVKAAQQMNARKPEQFVRGRMASLDESVSQLNQALIDKNWPTAHERAHEAMGAADDLAATGANAATLLALNEPAKIEELRTQLNVMADSLRKAWVASRRGNAGQTQVAMQTFHEAYRGLLRETTPTNK